VHFEADVSAAQTLGLKRTICTLIRAHYARQFTHIKCLTFERDAWKDENGRIRIGCPGDFFFTERSFL